MFRSNRTRGCGLLLALIGLVGCLDLTAPTNGRVNFQLDAACRTLIVGPQHFALSVDGDLIGGADLGAGDVSAEFAVTMGTHTLAATVPTLAVFLTWEPVTVTVERGQLVTYLMLCR